MRAILEGRDNIDYVTTDLEMSDVSLRMDITDLLFRDAVFDYVICSHVLEHVDDDRAAMREIARVLRPDGEAVIMVPILHTPDGRTVEDPAIVAPEDRERVYGQRDHVRKYGRDFPQRAAQAGFAVRTVRVSDFTGAETAARHGLVAGEEIFVCTRPTGANGGAGASRPATTEAAPAHVRPTVSREIAPGDPMLNPDRTDHYFAVGADALRIIEDAMAANDVPPPRTILDLPSGYGRVTRMLVDAFPNASITACDVNPEMVGFCERTFGVEGLVAPRDPKELALSGSYDLIWCGSLLTHLPEASWHALLERLAPHLTAEGLFIFTTHGDAISGLLREGRMKPPIAGPTRAALCDRYFESGFAFERYGSSVDGSYGFTLTSKDWVQDAVERCTGLRLESHSEADWDGKQDVVVCRPSG